MNALSRHDDDFGSAPDGAMAYITDMLGTAFRDKMIATMGGTSVKVPVRNAALSEDHPLVKCLGEIDAAELLEIMPGETFYVPIGNKHADAVTSLVLSGKTNNEISRALHISDRQVH